MRAKNIDGLADMYTTDCRYMPPGSPVLIGQEGMYGKACPPVEL